MPIAALEAKLASVPTAAGRFATIVRWGSKLGDEAIDALGGQAVVEKQVHDLYDRYVVPLDLPGVPGLAEPAVDAVFKRLLSALIWSVDDEG